MFCDCFHGFKHMVVVKWNKLCDTFYGISSFMTVCLVIHNYVTVTKMPLMTIDMIFKKCNICFLAASSFSTCVHLLAIILFTYSLSRINHCILLLFLAHPAAWVLKLCLYWAEFPNEVYYIWAYRPMFSNKTRKFVVLIQTKKLSTNKT